MSLIQDWQDLIQSQTDETFEAFWKEYAEGEQTLYTAMLEGHDEKYTGTIKDLAEKYGVRPVIVMGFLDGIQSSLNKAFDLDKLKDNDVFTLDIDFEKLYFNMHKAKANHLFSLPAWEQVLSVPKMAEIVKSYRRTLQVKRPKKIGRNDPCPCGSGKKYKYCCMKKDMQQSSSW